MTKKHHIEIKYEPGATPASNEEIAALLYRTLDGVQATVVGQPSDLILAKGSIHDSEGTKDCPWGAAAEAVEVESA